MLCALQKIFADLSGDTLERLEGDTRAISADALRIALSATEAGARFKLGDMADAVEAFEALLVQLKGANASRATSLFDIAGDGEQFVLHAGVATLREVSQRPFDEALRAVTIGSANGGGAGLVPEVFTLGLAWDTSTYFLL